MTDADSRYLDPSPHAAFIAGLPKVELHVHHVGSASPAIVAALAARHPGTVPTDPDALREYFTFRDFDHFIERYLAVANLVVTPEDVRLLTYGVATEMAAQGIRYAELTATPYTSVLAGIPIEGFVEATEDGRLAAERDHGVRIGWVFDIPGEVVPHASEETARLAVDHGLDSLVGFGLGGPEVGTTRPRHKPAFDRARAAGLHSVPHAGESTGPQTIWDALDALGAERIGTGPPRPRTRRCSPFSPSARSRSRCARRRTSPHAASTPTTRTRCGRWSTRACS